jgi:predicted nucleic acid-binding protein
MTLVVDATVAVKWFVNQPDSAKAKAIADGDDVLLAPDFIVAEVGNALWMHVRVKDISLEDAIEAVTALLPYLLTEIVPSTALSEAALRMATALNHSVYDCLYAVLALERRGTFVTDDRRFAEKLRVSRRLPTVKLLSEIKLTS